MSLSRFFKDQGEFIPESLVPRPPKDSDNWKPVTISEDRFEDQMPQFGQPQTKTNGAEADIFVHDSSQIDTTVNTISDKFAEIHSENAVLPDEPIPQPTLSPPLPDIKKLQEDAFQAGVAEGLKQAEADFGSGTKALSQACEFLTGIRETILKNSKNEMIELVIALSEKIIRHSVTEQNQTILDTVEEAILQAVKSSEFYIYLHPDDMAIIQERSSELISRINGLENIVVKTDPSIEQGGCKIESDNCTVDATLLSQLEIIHNHIKQ